VTARDPGSPAGTVLAGSFAAADRADWEALVGDLDRLRSTTYDGLTIEPLYTADDLPAPPVGLPGFAPFVRGRTPGGTRRGWDVRQIVDHRGARLAITELERGATSLLVDLRSADRIDAELVSSVLDGVLLEVAPVVLDAGPRWAAAAEALAAHWDRLGLAPDAVSGSLGADPFGSLASGRSTVDIDAQLADAATWTRRMHRSYPAMRTFVLNGTRFHNAGASDAQELGLTMANVVATLRALTDDGSLDAGAALAQVELRLAATADQFATIAKFRAGRRLIARVAEIAGVPEAAAHAPLHAMSSSAMMTRYDPSVNMLRGTVACFAAGVGGADAVTVLPFDYYSAPGSSELGRRLARNTQSVLAMESHLADVIDPAGGSWYVERLTADTAGAAWEVFQEVERAGGFRAAVEGGLVGDAIAEMRDRRTSDVHRRLVPVTGVTEFPNIAEPAPVAATRPAEPPDGSLVEHRWIEDVELLRQRVDEAATTCERPTVHLATIGPPAQFTARASFAKNLFEVAGFATQAGPASSDPAEIAAALTGRITCICSSDEVYGELGAAVAAALREAGASRIYLAGRPAELLGELTDAGVTHTLTARSDVLATLTALVDEVVGPAVTGTDSR
jgi:methylmalonyl-CoA mutase